MRKPAAITLCLILFTTCQLRGAAEEPKLGPYHTTFADRSPLSAMTEISRHMGFSLKALDATQFEKDYDISRESFEVYVPESYKPEEKWGLIVWINAGTSGRPPEVFIPLLTKHKLLWIGPNNVQNERAYWCRIGLAIDAAQNMKKQYAIDETRIYVSGGSGGGRTSSMAGVAFPDVFTGGLYIIGCNFYRDITVPAEHVKELEAKGEGPKEPGPVIWRKSFSPPPAKLFALAKKNSRHAIITGETDMNRSQCKENFAAYKKDGFEHVSYFEVPGMGHSMPPSDWLDRALDTLDNPTSAVAAKDTPAQLRPTDNDKIEKAKGALKAAQELAAKDAVAGYSALQEVAHKYSDTPVAVDALKAADTLKTDSASKKKIEDAEEADKFLRVAKIYIDNRMLGQARIRLEKILSDYASAPAAKEAKDLLKKIGTAE